MPITISDAPVKIHFRDSANKVIAEDVFFTIRPELDHGVVSRYLTASARIRFDAPDLDEDEEKVRTAHDVLVAHGLLSIEGVNDAAGNPIQAADWRRLPHRLSIQIVRALQERSRTGSDPNAGAPSADSSSGKARRAS